MEYMEAPIPATSMTETGEDNVKEGKKFFISKDSDVYVLICSKTNTHLILNLKLSNKILYESILNKNNLIKISNLFTLCDDMEESYNVLIDNLSKNENDIKIDFIDKNTAKLLFSLELPTKRKDYTYIMLQKKKQELKISDINDNINELITKIDTIQENQNKLEKKVEEKFEGINIIIDKQNNLEKELKSKIQEIEEIRNLQSKLEKNFKNNENKIEKIDKKQKDILLEIENIKIDVKNSDEKNNQEKKDIEEIKESLPDIDEKIELLKENQNEVKNILNNNDEELDKLSENLAKCENSLIQVNSDIASIKEKESKIMDEIKETNEEIKKIKSNNKQLEKNEENGDLAEKIMKQIEELKKENVLLKKKISNNEKNLELIKKKLIEMGDDKIYPGDFKFKKTISSDLFDVNVYNNRACIFSSCQDDNVYVVYGKILSFNLECYDVLNDTKFIIIKKLHNDSFDSCRYNFDEDKKRDLIITASLDSHVKVVNFKKDKSEIIIDLNFESEKDKVIINTAIFVHETILIPFSNERTLKFYTMNSDYIGQLEEDVGFVLGLSKYFSEMSKNHYALIANTQGIFIYIIESFSLYHKFIPPEPKKSKEEKEKKGNGFDEAYIIEKDGKKILIGPCFYYEYIYFWDFAKGDLIYTLDTICGISDICLWNNKYIFASYHGSSINQFILINTNKMEIEKRFKKDGKEHYGAGIKVLRTNTKGNFLISISTKGKLDLYSIENKSTPL